MAFRTPYMTERGGQAEFFDSYGIPYTGDDSVLIDNTDGVYNGCIIEFKLSISSLNKVLFQAVKYLSRMRIRGESVPATIILVDLNKTTAYIYESEDYRNAIHRTYAGAASKDNSGFAAGSYNSVIDYSTMEGASDLRKLLRGKKKDPDEMYIPISIDESCIIGWAERYYREVPNASKGDFLGDGTGRINLTGEIRDPRHFKGLINPYTEKTNERFAYLMDCLNSRLAKKDLGAFYTPEPYARKAAELVQKAVERVPEGNDYIILDRCSGTGSLESALIGLKDRNGDELISHCVVSTYEYYEYKVLMERVGDLVRDVIPPTEANICFENGVISNADAMSEEYVNNPIIRKYVENEKCTIILYENVPYRDVTSNSTGIARAQNSYVFEKMRKEISGAVLNDLSNRFIWSGFKYYLRQPTDSYIVFSPVKYFKTCGLVNKTMKDGYLFNRKHFHATESAISCILWFNEDKEYDSVELHAFDINGGNLVDCGYHTISKACESYSKFLYDKRTFADDKENGICCNLDGSERTNNKTIRVKKIYNDNMIGYIRASSFNFDALSRQLLRCGEYDGNGFFLRSDNYKEKLPLWVAKMVPLDNWYEKDVYATTSDGGDAYTHDESFLKSCLLYTVLSNQNKCLSFWGSDGRYYRNELTLDDTNGDTVASADLTRLFAKYPPDCEEQKLINLWGSIMEEAAATDGYDPSITYGVYQIAKELNTFTVTGSGRSKRKVYDYPDLNGNLDALRTTLKEYYKSHITKKMFEYQLLK